MQASEYLVGEAARVGTVPVLGSMWGRLVHCEDSGVQDRADMLALFPSSSSLWVCPTSRISYRRVPGWFLGQIEARGLGWRLHVFSREGLRGQEITVRRRRCLSWDRWRWEGHGHGKGQRRSKGEPENTKHSHAEPGWMGPAGGSPGGSRIGGPRGRSWGTPFRGTDCAW